MRNARKLKYSDLPVQACVVPADRPVRQTDELFEREACLFEWSFKTDEEISKKKRELSIENLKLRLEIEELKKVSFIDAATEIHNKRYLQIRLGEEFARARRYGSPLSSIFIDMDDFKSVNDIYGHIIGDRLLKEVASVLEDLCRSEDVLVRFGGEEFVILMSDTGNSEAVVLAERIRKKIEEHLFSYEDINISVSASLGVSTLNNGDFEYVSDPEQLIRMADRAMYMVKQNGKNNTCYLPFRLEKGNPVLSPVCRLPVAAATQTDVGTGRGVVCAAHE
ncbi:MAG: GGDEF domain-containing protein [Spirochaetales bacterium]|jgi:diguanylate cyclase (GGDEF)-like protein|nr:GGDEF domain-containing protein [Spirochaetales bacterium]